MGNRRRRLLLFLLRRRLLVEMEEGWELCSEGWLEEEELLEEITR